MRIGVGVMTGPSADQAVNEVNGAWTDGFDSAWISHIFGADALTAAAVAGAQVEGIDVGTFVVPVYTRHPLTMAQGALTAQSACRGRFTLGIGLSHQVVVENVMGIPFTRPARYMTEYLSVLVALLDTGSVSFSGDVFTVNATIEKPAGVERPPVIVAALGPVMLELAGTVADGTATWMTGLETLKSHTVPTITAAAVKAGRPAPRIVAGLPVCVTTRPEEARERAERVFSVYGVLPSYRAMLDREGAAGPGDVSIVGDEEAVAAALAELKESGVTEFVAAPFGNGEEMARTRFFVAEAAGTQ